MSKIYGAYLEDYHLIKVIIPLETVFTNIILKNFDSEPLNLIREEQYAQERHLYLETKKEILPHLDYDVIINEDLKYHLHLGKITRTKKFDDDNFYEGVLGIIYTKEKTIFRIWSPVCKEIYLVLNEKKYHLKFKQKGLWEKTINKDCDGLSYYYLIRINEEFIKVLDPYAISSNFNHEYNIVVDMMKTIKIDQFYELPSNANVIYETSIRDISGNVNNSESSYLKAKEHLDYFANLKINYLQLMPCFSFGGVDENIKNENEPGFQYNWGYNPIQYFIPSGWLASVDDGYGRINEFKELIKEIKSKKMGIIMDVVYNHVYDYENFSLGQLIPGYVYRTNEKGFLMNSSYCGNDLRTEAKMIRKFIIDNLCFWTTEYHIDGFRFDLMGLIDKETIKLAYEKLKKINPNVLMYGEGWYMHTTLEMENNANLSQAKYLVPCAFFNDYYRNLIGGKLNGEKGFIGGLHLAKENIKDLLFNGSRMVMPFDNFMQSINYIECHDNLTIFDKLVKTFPNYSLKKIKAMAKLGLGLVILSQGISFIHSGQELLRSKKGNDNSYNLPDVINHFPWENIDTYLDISRYLKALIRLKKHFHYENVVVYDKKTYYEIRFSNIQIIIKNDFVKDKIYFAPVTTMIFNNEEEVNNEIEILEVDSPGIWIIEK